MFWLPCVGLDSIRKAEWEDFAAAHAAGLNDLH